MRPLWRLAAALVVCALLSSCALPFYVQAIGGQLELLRKRVPIAELLADESLDPELRATLTAVAQIRRFASDDLLLPDNDSYTTYVRLDRPYVVWNVVAAEEFSVDPKTWCFPFAGCVAYRGFFDRDRAEAFRARLDRRGFDTYSGGATAYSTLGYFDDPVLSTMVGGGEQYIASVLFHELAHQRLYVKDDSEFNEAFATAVEEHGTELWLERRDPSLLPAYHRRLAARAAFARLVADQQARLRAVYASDVSPEEKRIAKERAFETMRADYGLMKQSLGLGGDYDAWFAQPLNNATLAAVATYRRWVPAMQAIIGQRGLAGFYAEMDALAELTLEQRKEALEKWLRDTSTTGVSPERGEPLLVVAAGEVDRRDGAHRPRLDAERGESGLGLATDARDLQRAEVVERDGFAGQ
jgi:predicted aminopeptidase